MIAQRKNIAKIIFPSILFILLMNINIKSSAQDSLREISMYQYRHVPDDKIAEFIKRETTYWSKVAQKGVETNKISFWGLFEKVGGYDLPNSSNFLFINTFPNIDSTGELWSTAEKTAGVTMDKMETNSMSTTTSQFYLHSEGWSQASFAKPDKDFNYVVMNYHNSSNPGNFVETENKYWRPFIQSAMDKKQTPQLGWGNAIVLSPSGDNIKFNSVSYDLFPSLRDALMPSWDPKIVFPTTGLDLLSHIRLNRMGSAVYRIVKVVSKN